MSSAGVFLLIGVLLLGHGGFYMLAMRRYEQPAPTEPEQPTSRETTQVTDEEDNDLDALLDEIDA